MEQVVGGAIEDGRFDLVLFVYNYAQQEMGNNILKACAEKNIGATLMKTDPFNGALITMSEQRIRAMKEKNTPIPENLKRSYELIMERQKKGEEYLAKVGLSDPASRRKAAIGFVLDNPVVSSVFISFMTFDEIGPYISLSGMKLSDVISENIEMLKRNYGHLYCRHACGICESNCPFGIPINTIMRYHHYYLGQRREKYAMQKYSELPGPKLEKCSACSGNCELACPYDVSIKALLMSACLDLTLTHHT
jgi:predicted aldo/keto reductase-like oxidoreductase